MKVIQVRRNMKVVQLDDGRVIELYRLVCPNCGKRVWQEYFEECGIWGKCCPECKYVFVSGGSYQCEEVSTISEIEERLGKIKRLTDRDVVRDMTEVEKRLNKIKDLLDLIKG
jgi:hypothetical protein